MITFNMSNPAAVHAQLNEPTDSVVRFVLEDSGKLVRFLLAGEPSAVACAIVSGNAQLFPERSSSQRKLAVALGLMS